MFKTFVNKNKIIIFLIIMGAVFSGIAGGAFLALTHDLPQIRSLETFSPSSVTRIYSSDKILLSELFVEKRDPVPFQAIPLYLKKALIATEDRNFYNHSGVDLKGILRAVIKDILKGEFVEGASTITQQLAKTLFLTTRKTLLRKIKEAILAFQLERRYTKNEILAFYLNQVYFGSGAYGVESAAGIFFGKPVQDLDIAQCALIAGLPKAPSRYSPLINANLSIKRRNTVLKQMKDTGIITKEKYEKAVKKPLKLSEKKNVSVLKAPYFIEYVKNILEKKLGHNKLYKGGLTVYTTCKFELQKTAQLAVADGLSSLEKRMQHHGLKNGYPQCGLISIDIQSGGILAMVGGRDFYKSPFNRAVTAERQPGSAFKPVVYALAIERGFVQNSLILDAPVVFKLPGKKKEWRPENFHENYMGEIPLRTALTLSRNIPAIRLLEILGPSSVVRFGHKLGIESVLVPNLSLALGTSEVTLMELTAAYSVFPNRGNYIKPFAVMDVVDKQGRIVWHVKPQKKVVMSRVGAAIMTDMLRGVIQEGTGKKAKVIKVPVGGKTGTTNDFKDAWFIGFSPSVATGVWVGRDEFKTLGKWETGARAALPIWIEFMKAALEHRTLQYFDIPDDMIKIAIDPLTGHPVSADSPHAVFAFFKKGTEP